MMKSKKFILFNLILILILFTSCTTDTVEASRQITIRDWTRNLRSEFIRESDSWQVYCSENFPVQKDIIHTMIERGELPTKTVSHISPKKPGTWFLHIDDSLAAALTHFVFKGDTIIIEDQPVNMNGCFLFTLIPSGINNRYHEVVIAGKKANPEILTDFINKAFLIPEPWFVYKRNVLILPDIKYEQNHKVLDYPNFVEGSVCGDWMQKIRQSSVPEVLAEAFETFVTKDPMPVIHDSLATFFWFEPSEDKPVYLLSDKTGWETSSKNRMKQIPQTPIHYYQMILHREARIEYLYRVGNEVKRDYLNPHYTGSGYFSHSVLTMPGRKPAPEISRPPLTFQSAIDEFTSNNGNRIRLILPPGYHHASSTYRTLYILNSYQNMFIIRTLMENLMLSGEIPPVIVVFAGNEPLRDLVYTVDERYRTMKKPEYRMVCAWSGETDRMVIDESLWANYLLFSPLDMPTIPDDKDHHFTLNISTGLYDLSEVNMITKALKTRYPDHTVVHYFPGGHHPEEWYRALIRELKKGL
ncbi:MAG TPA: hypothetical protein DEH00_02720 [Candidatus Marinimicrobia bacterium]|nr:hypothetical protein [Candidatus Neomarinimicrobiota bacterium]